MAKKNPYTSDEEPDNVHQGVEATVRSVCMNDFLAERPQGQYTQFQGLQAERNADDGDE